MFELAILLNINYLITKIDVEGAILNYNTA